MRRLAVFVSALACASSAQASCIPIETFWSPALFARYPVKSSQGPWRVPNVLGGEAHRFRTMVNRYGQGEPDFAGHYRILSLGCGTGSDCPIFVDRASGRVAFSPVLRVASLMPVDLGASRRLTYRRDSRLLVLIGVRDEDEKTAGASLFEWRAGGLHLIRFVPRRRLCVVSCPRSGCA